MKIVKYILIVVGALVVIVLALGAVVKSEYAVERSITINKPRQDVFNYVKLLKNQDNYSKWAMLDKNMKKEYTGDDGTVGFISAWDSDHKEVGKGEQEIKKIEDGKRLDFELRFKIPFEVTDYAYMSTEDAAGGTTVKWGFFGKMPYPMNIMMLFMDMDNMLGKDLEIGLTNLKTVLEKP